MTVVGPSLVLETAYAALPGGSQCPRSHPADQPGASGQALMGVGCPFRLGDCRHASPARRPYAGRRGPVHGSVRASLWGTRRSGDAACRRRDAPLAGSHPLVFSARSSACAPHRRAGGARGHLICRRGAHWPKSVLLLRTSGHGESNPSSSSSQSWCHTTRRYPVRSLPLAPGQGPCTVAVRRPVRRRHEGPPGSQPPTRPTHAVLPLRHQRDSNPQPLGS